MAEVLLLRHGKRRNDRLDPGLAPEGLADIEAMGRRLAQEGGWQALYCSPLRRARETAALLAPLLGLQPVVEEGLAEAPLLQVAWLTAVQALRPRRAWPWPGREAARARLAGALRRLAARHPGGKVLAVSHGALMLSLLDRWWTRRQVPLCNLRLWVDGGLSILEMHGFEG